MGRHPQKWCLRFPVEGRTTPTSTRGFLHPVHFVFFFSFPKTGFQNLLGFSFWYHHVLVEVLKGYIYIYIINIYIYIYVPGRGPPNAVGGGGGWGEGVGGLGGWFGFVWGWFGGGVCLGLAWGLV